jgi:TetR/AcrR family transcriptional repressor of lfrA
VLGQNPAAPLQEIATAADVGRTTLHRYFAERSDLLAAVRETGVARINQAYARARLDDGTGAEALRRLCQEYFDLGSLLSLVFSDPQLIGDEAWADRCDPGFFGMVERGHRDGSIDPTCPRTGCRACCGRSSTPGGAT